MKIKEYQFETPTVTIYDQKRRFYYGPVDEIPSHLLRMNIVHVVVVRPINNTNIEVGY